MRYIVISAAEQSTVDSSMVDSVELYHLAGAYDKVVETVNRALGQSLSSGSSLPLSSGSQSLSLSGAFGGVSDLESLGQRVAQIYERDLSRRSQIGKNNWETMTVLLRLKQAMREFAGDRPDLALQVSRALLCVSAGAT
jgi:nuclear pore complex protein Nup93